MSDFDMFYASTIWVVAIGAMQLIDSRGRGKVKRKNGTQNVNTSRLQGGKLFVFHHDF